MFIFLVKDLETNCYPYTMTKYSGCDNLLTQEYQINYFPKKNKSLHGFNVCIQAIPRQINAEHE